MGSGAHTVVDLTTQQIAVFRNGDKGVDYSLRSLHVRLPERRLLDGNFNTAVAFKIPATNLSFLKDYAIDILKS